MQRGIQNSYRALYILSIKLNNITWIYVNNLGFYYFVLVWHVDNAWFSTENTKLLIIICIIYIVLIQHYK